MCNKGTTLEGGLNTRRGYACVGPGGIWEISVSSAHFAVNPIQTAVEK